MKPAPADGIKRIKKDLIISLISSLFFILFMGQLGFGIIWFFLCILVILINDYK